MKTQNKRQGWILVGLIIFCVIGQLEARINNNMFEAKLLVNKQMPVSRMQAAGHRFSIQSSDSNYQLSGDVYQSSQVISQQKQIYNISNYKKSQSCTYFKSILQMNSLQGENLNYVSLESMVSEDTQELFVIGTTDDELFENKKFVKIYSYGNTNFGFKSEVSFQNTTLSQDINVDVYMTKIGNATLFSDGNYPYRLDSVYDQKAKKTTYSWKRVEGWNTGKNVYTGQEFLGFRTVTYQDKQLLLCLYTQKLVFFQYNQQQNTANTYIQILKSGEDAFQDAQISPTHIYIIAGNQLLIYTPQNLIQPIRQQLAGQLCTRIYIYHSTIHVICEYQKRNFIGEYFYNQTLNVMILNRFYNDIQNYRLLSYINNYFLMIGENDIILTSNGVNRRILLDMPKNAYSEKFVSFGIQSIQLLKQLKTEEFSQVLFAVGEDFVVLFELKFVPAEVWCYIERPPESLQKNILIVRNTSQCEMSQNIETLKSICINLKPVQIFFQHYQIESKMTSIFIIIVILLAFVLALLCLGFVFRQNRNYNDLLVEIKEKITTLKKPKTQEMKQI